MSNYCEECRLKQKRIDELEAEAKLSDIAFDAVQSEIEQLKTENSDKSHLLARYLGDNKALRKAICICVREEGIVYNSDGSHMDTDDQAVEWFTEEYQDVQVMTLKREPPNYRRGND